MSRRILTTCTECGAGVQTDDDQVPTESGLFEELVINLTDMAISTDHVHQLVHEDVS